MCVCVLLLVWVIFTEEIILVVFIFSYYQDTSRNEGTKLAPINHSRFEAVCVSVCQWVVFLSGTAVCVVNRAQSPLTRALILWAVSGRRKIKQHTRLTTHLSSMPSL